MDVLFQIARHPVFSKTVTELIYNITEIGERLTDYGVYKREKGYEFLDGYAEFCKLYAAQEAPR